MITRQAAGHPRPCTRATRPRRRGTAPGPPWPATPAPADNRHRIRRPAITLASLAPAVLAFGAATPPALATPLPPDPGPAGIPVVRTVISGGMPGWQITLAAVGAALCAALVAVLLARAWAVRRRAAHAAA